MNQNKILDKEFYLSNGVTSIAQALLGKVLCSYIDGSYTSGMICETEAYSGTNDKACHANNNKRTSRTEIMYANGGVAYVYLCYGIHHLFNIVTNKKDCADAVLIRAIEPIDGMDTMLQRRNIKKHTPKLTSGPGVLTQALGITTKNNGTSLFGNIIWIEDRGIIIKERLISSSKRIGVEYAQEDALKNWRFYIKGNKWVSGKR